MSVMIAVALAVVAYYRAFSSATPAWLEGTARRQQLAVFKRGLTRSIVRCRSRLPTTMLTGTRVLADSRDAFATSRRCTGPTGTDFN